MITARFVKKLGHFTSFSVSGHSGFAAQGEDIVCAGVTACVQYALNLLDCFGSDGKSAIDADVALIKYDLVLPCEYADKIVSVLHNEISYYENLYPKFIKTEVLTDD